MATTWQLLAQLDILHQLQPPAFEADDEAWEPPYEKAEADACC
jgi:hypothetical protein